MNSPYKTFKGTGIEYRQVHEWVRSKLGLPSMCENCEGRAEGARNEWANISGQYLLDTSDWASLCTRCHRLIDGNNLGFFRKGEGHPNWNGDRCQKGHEYTAENTRFRVGYDKRYDRSYRERICRTCQAEYYKQFVLRRRTT